MEMQEQIHDLVMNSETILDVGARDGYDALVYSDINPQANIYCFESSAGLFLTLQKNVYASGAKNITLLQNAIGSKNKIVRLGPDEDSDDVEMITIDSLNLIGCDFIKVGTGSVPTRLVISGAINTIKRFTPAILYQKTQEVNEILEGIGYKFTRHGANTLAISSSASQQLQPYIRSV
jgi:FkbM family methyltransferase